MKIHGTHFSSGSMSKLRSGYMKDIAVRIDNFLKSTGSPGYDIISAEISLLPLLLRPTESVDGIAFGKYWFETETEESFGLIIATDKRVILLDKKAESLRDIEIPYRGINEIMLLEKNSVAELTLTGPTGNVKMQPLNTHMAQAFVDTVENTIRIQKTKKHNRRTRWTYRILPTVLE